jgi:prophage tail gpP-like protein
LFGHHGGATESKSSGLTELQLMEKGQWSSTAAMGNYHDDEGKQKRKSSASKRRPKSAKQEARK